MRWLRILIRVLGGLSLLSFLLYLSTSAAYADNCGSLNDCFATTDAAAGVTIAVAIIIAVALFALPQLLEQPPVPPTPERPPAEPGGAAEMGERRAGETGSSGEAGEGQAELYPPVQPAAPHIQPISEQALPAQAEHPGIHATHEPEIYWTHQQGHQQHHHHPEHGHHPHDPILPTPPGIPVTPPHIPGLPPIVGGQPPVAPGFPPVVGAPPPAPPIPHVPGGLPLPPSPPPAPGHLPIDPGVPPHPAGSIPSAPEVGPGGPNPVPPGTPPSELPAPPSAPPGTLPGQQLPQVPAEPQIPHPGSYGPILQNAGPEAQIPRPEPEAQIPRPLPEAQRDIFPQIVPAIGETLIQSVGQVEQSEVLPGIHHVTALTSNPQLNLDFYTGLLGFRLVKMTVNYDEPGIYQLYYGDALGQPGTVLSFLCNPRAPRGSRGTGQVVSISFAVPEGTLQYWAEHLSRNGIVIGGPHQRFGRQMISFFDPDGLQIDLVAQPSMEEPTTTTWQSRIPSAFTVRHFDSISIAVVNQEQTGLLLHNALNFQPVAEAGNRRRYQTGQTHLDVVHLPTVPPGANGAGTVHHIAWRTQGDVQQQGWHTRLKNMGINVSPINDRYYFREFTFQEPGGVLFTVATDTPGFLLDEWPDQLGTHLTLPPWLEQHRSNLLQTLPPLRLPTSEQGR